MWQLLVILAGGVGVLLVPSLGGNPVELRFVAQAVSHVPGYTVYCPPLLPGLGGGTDSDAPFPPRQDWYRGCRQQSGTTRRGRLERRIAAGCHFWSHGAGGISAGLMLALCAPRPGERRRSCCRTYHRM